MKGNIFNIQRFSLHDGPGIRTTVFFKGCNMRCAWCHNPESFNSYPELLFNEEKCSSCGRCVGVCPNKAMTISNGKVGLNRKACGRCFACVEVCLNNARQEIGGTKESSQIIDIVLKDKNFYQNSGGGVTFSGGEPLLQLDFLKELLTIAKQNDLGTAVETAANISNEAFKEIIDLTDLFMIDIKLFDPGRHKKAIGVTNEKILENIKWLSQKGAETLIRIPVIPSINDDVENITQTAIFLSDQTKFKNIELLSFHKSAEGKYENLNLHYPAANYSLPDKQRMVEISKILESFSFQVKIS